MKYSDIQYTQPTLEGGGYTFQSKRLWLPRISPNHPTYAGLLGEFDVEQFLYPRPPIDLGSSGLSYCPSPIVNVLRMPIKFPRSDYRIPGELKWLDRTLRYVADYEATINKLVDTCFVHITVDRAILQAGDSHRFPGWHGDGFQGTRTTPKVPIEHSYILTSFPTTEFCLQPFFLKHLDEAKHNVFEEFDTQVKDVNIVKALPWHLYLLDPYMVHRTPPITRPTERLFVRITYCFSELQNPHNTLNPLFPGAGQYKDRHDIRNFLTQYPGEIPMEMYGFQK